MKRKPKFKLVLKGRYYILYRRRWYGWAFEAKSTVREHALDRMYEVQANAPEYF